MLVKRWPLLIIILTLTLTLTLTLLALTACGTLQVGLEPDLTPAQGQTALPSNGTPGLTEATDDLPPATQIPATPQPADTTLPDQDFEASPPTETSTPEAETPSPLWSTYRDPKYGFGFAYPCFWLNQGSIRSYDDRFAMEHSIRSHWIDNQPPAGVVKIDLGILDYAEYGFDPQMPLGEAITQRTGDPYGDGRAAFESIEETSLAGKTVYRVNLGQLADSWGGDGQQESYYFPLEPGRYLHLLILPTGAVDSPSVQGLLESLALSAGEEIAIPNHDPDPPVAGRELYVNEEAGYCFHYPAEYQLETYGAGAGSFLGETASLKLDRPLYTVGLTAQVQQVGEGGSLAGLVDNVLLGLSDEAVAGIRRNPAELVAGIGIRLGGEPAEALDGMPGLVNSLDIFALHDGRLVQVVFTPSPFDNPQANDDIWAIYDVVMASFSFLP